MQVFFHHIYEYEKGIRNVILHTLPKENKVFVEAKLQRKNISYLIREIPGNKINVFFGKKSCIDALKLIGDKSLTDFTPEEDFMLGVMLGYDRLKQVERYITRKEEQNKLIIAM